MILGTYSMLSSVASLMCISAHSVPTTSLKEGRGRCLDFLAGSGHALEGGTRYRQLSNVKTCREGITRKGPEEAAGDGLGLHKGMITSPGWKQRKHVRPGLEEPAQQPQPTLSAFLTVHY